ncbi:MAG: DNA starvation/stationary phase protection protein [Prolixibacteraceae bacterium]|jgi:starvation-inducible DNA-binding protein
MKKSTETPSHNNEIVVTFLNILLADEYVLYTKTRTAHWNIDGSNYFELHVFLENQYNTLDVIIDDLAEQIRSLGHYALGSLKDFLSIAQMSEDNHDFTKSGKIFETLLSDHETIIAMLQHEILSVSNKLNARNTAVFLTGLLEQHKKMVWMLKFLSSNPEYSMSNQIPANSSQLMDWQD